MNWFPSFACHLPSNSNQNQIYQNQKTKIKITATKFSSVIHYTKGVSGEYTDLLSSECELPLFEAPKHPVWQVGNIWPLRMYTKMLISFYPFNGSHFFLPSSAKVATYYMSCLSLGGLVHFWNQ